MENLTLTPARLADHSAGIRQSTMATIADLASTRRGVVFPADIRHQSDQGRGPRIHRTVSC